MTMKMWMCILVAALFSCENEKNAGKESASFQEEIPAQISYEGRIPLDENTSLYIELSMVPSAAPGEGRYEIKEFLEREGSNKRVSSFQGKYSTLYGEDDDDRVIQFHHSASAEGVKRTYLTPGFKKNITDSRLNVLRTETFRTTDLTARPGKNHKMIILDERLHAITRDEEHNLVKRTSRLFTFEGYFRHNGDSADFREMNTGDVWAVSKYGDYRKAIRQYHQLTKTKFEVTYIKGTGFSIRHVNGRNEEIDALVIRKVLVMTAIPESGLR